MKVEKKEKYTLISSDEKTFEEFYARFKAKKDSFIDQHLIINLKDSLNAKNNEVALFMDFADEKKENGTSFVVVDTNVDIDDFPETFNLTPTLQEAEDILEMEAIERELGF